MIVYSISSFNNSSSKMGSDQSTNCFDNLYALQASLMANNKVAYKRLFFLCYFLNKPHAYWWKSRRKINKIKSTARNWVEIARHNLRKSRGQRGERTVSHALLTPSSKWTSCTERTKESWRSPSTNCFRTLGFSSLFGRGFPFSSIGTRVGGRSQTRTLNKIN